MQTVNMFLKLGFAIHPAKSVLIPTQQLEFLGVLLNSISMSIHLPPRKATNVRQACEDHLHQHNPTIRDVAHVIGLIVSSFPEVQYGELYYRYLEQEKIQALQASRGDYDAPTNLSQEARSNLHWWVNNVTCFPKYYADQP